MLCKLKPVSGAKINFPGFQQILDFTSAGSESSVSVTVDGDTDKEYKIMIRNLDAADAIYATLDGSTACGYQLLKNASGTISASRGATAVLGICQALSLADITFLLPTGFLKTSLNRVSVHSSGTTMSEYHLYGIVNNDTSGTSSMEFTPASGNFTAGTRITVYARRS